MKHASNAMLRAIFSLLEEEGAGELHIGDLNGIRKDANHGRKGDQKLHNFRSFDLVEERIMELGEERGTTVRKPPRETPRRRAASAGDGTTAGWRGDRWSAVKNIEASTPT